MFCVRAFPCRASCWPVATVQFSLTARTNMHRHRLHACTHHSAVCVCCLCVYALVCLCVALAVRVEQCDDPWNSVMIRNTKFDMFVSVWTKQPPSVRVLKDSVALTRVPVCHSMLAAAWIQAWASLLPETVPAQATLRCLS